MNHCRACGKPLNSKAILRVCDEKCWHDFSKLNVRPKREPNLAQHMKPYFLIAGATALLVYIGVLFT